MINNRKQIEKRIIKILSYTKNDRLLNILLKNINSYNNDDLKLILEYLETGNLEYLEKLLDNRVDKYKTIGKNIDNKKILEKKKKNLEEEKKEKEEEKKEIEGLIN